MIADYELLGPSMSSYAAYQQREHGAFTRILRGYGNWHTGNKVTMITDTIESLWRIDKMNACTHRWVTAQMEDDVEYDVCHSCYCTIKRM